MHGSGSTDFIAVDYEELVFVDAATKCGGYDMPHGEPGLERFERIAAAYLAEAEVEGLTIIRYDIVSLLVTGSEKAFLRHRKNVLNDRGDPEAAAPGLWARDKASARISLN